ncbi:HalOD1 output domain-containing protein [Halopiger thermotolerans]
MPTNDNGGTDSGDDLTLNRERHWQQTAQRLYEPERDGGLTTAIVFAIAEAKEVSPSEVKSPPLYESVDVAGIEDAFFGSKTRRASRQGAGTVEFCYADHLIKVRSDGWVQVYEPTGTELS